MKTFKKLVKEFEYYINIEKNYSFKTSRTYLNNLRDFEKYIEEYNVFNNLLIENINKDHIKNYLMHLKINRSNKATTINNKISTLKSFYGFLSGKSYISAEDNITTDLRHQKLPKILPIYLTYEEAETLLLGTKLLSNNSTRDYAILCTYLLTGARLSEIVNLEIEQISFSNKTILLMGKGSKERTVPMVERVENSLKEYLNTNINNNIIKPRCSSVDTKVIFLNKYGRPISERGMQEIVVSLMKKTGVYKQGLSTHKLRHTCFTLLHRSGVDILKIQQMAGHENIKSTAIYTHLNEKDLYQSMQKNPLNANGYTNELINKIKDKYTKK